MLCTAMLDVRLPLDTLAWRTFTQTNNLFVAPAACTSAVGHRHCVEKEDIVQLVIKTYKSGATSKFTASSRAAAATKGDRPPPCDLSRWRHMALFFTAEAGEAAEGRTAAVTSTYKAAVGAAQHNDDELYGCLCAWNAVKAIVDGGSSWRVGDMLKLLDYAAMCEIKSKAWKGYELLIQPRIKILKKPLRDRIQVGYSMLCKAAYRHVCYGTLCCVRSAHGD